MPYHPDVEQALSAIGQRDHSITGEYRIFGPPGTLASISYFDVNADPTRVEKAPLPWSLEFASTEATAVGSIVAQGDSSSIGCRILVDGEVKAERISNEVNAFTFCVLKAA